MLICLSMDKWALRSHFYSYVDSVRLFYNIGPCFHVIEHIVFWVELPVKRRLCRIFVKSWVLKEGTQWCGVGLPASTNLPRVDGLSTDPWDLGCQITPSTTLVKRKKASITYVTNFTSNSY